MFTGRAGGKTKRTNARSVTAAEGLTVAFLTRKCLKRQGTKVAESVCPAKTPLAFRVKSVAHFIMLTQTPADHVIAVTRVL